MNSRLSDLDRLAAARPRAAFMTEALVGSEEREAIVLSIMRSGSVDDIEKNAFSEALVGGRARVIASASPLVITRPAPRRVVVGVLLIALVGAIALVATRGGTSQRIFPLGSHAAISNNGPGVKRSWQLASVIAHQTEAESQIVNQQASMLSCATTTECYAISDPPTTDFTSAPGYLMALSAGYLDFSSDGGNNWNTKALPAGMVLTTPLDCKGSSNCVAGALLLGKGESVSQAAPPNSPSIVQGLLHTGSALASDSSCNLNAFDESNSSPATSGALSASETLAVLDEFSSVASQVGPMPNSNQCADNLMRGVLLTVAYANASSSGEGIPALLGENPFSKSLLASLGQDLQAMTLYETSGMTPVVESTTDGGTSWSTVALPSGTGPVIDLTCPTSSTCEGLAWTGQFQTTDLVPWAESASQWNLKPVQLIKTTDDGATWTTSGFPDFADAPTSLVCPNASSCIASGAIKSSASSRTPDLATRGLVLITSDGGTSWTQARIPSNVSLVNDPTCPSAESCYAIGAMAGSSINGSVVLSSNDGGSTWVTMSLPVSLTGAHLTSISCPMTTSCALSGALPGGTETGRGSNGYSAVDGPNGPYSPLSGPGSGPAMIVSTDDGGASWAVQTFGWREANGNQLLRTTQVLCTSPNICLAIGGSSSFSSPVLVGST